MRTEKPLVLLFYLMWLFHTSSLHLVFGFPPGLSTIAMGVPDETGGIPTFNPAETSPPPPPPPTTTIPGESGGEGRWCAASPAASPTALQVALDYACGYGGANCTAIQSGGSCADPDTLHDHASFAFNDYYQKNPTPTSCVFGGAAQFTTTDPSSGNCHYSSTPATQASPSPPSLTPPITPSTPGGPTIYGTDPTESAGSEKSIPGGMMSMMMFAAVVLAAFVRREET